MKVTVKVEGLRECEEALRELPKSTGKAVLRRVLAVAARPIYQAAKARAPSRPGDAPAKYFKRGGQKRLRRPGTLDALVQAGSRLTRRQASIARKEGKSSAEYYVGTRDPVGRLIEFGTYEAAPEPFLRPAWDEHASDALELIKSNLWAEIQKSAARLAAKAARLAAKG